MLSFDGNTVGRAIKALRTERHLSQDVLSGLAGIARTHLTMIETGAKLPNLETLCKLSDALGMRPSEVIRFMEDLSEMPIDP